MLLRRKAFHATFPLLAIGISVALAQDAGIPKNFDVLFWSIPQRDAAFRQMEKVGPTHTITATKGKVHKFGVGKPISLSIDLDAHMKAQRTAGLLVIQDNKVRLEKYGLGYNADGRWTSFSVAKSFTSTLAGAAVKDGYIKSLDDKVSKYIPDMKGSAYDDVTVRQLLTMTSGVKWNEDYFDPKSDVAMFSKHVAEPGVDVTVSYMRKLPREAPAGSKWVYKTGETNLIGVLVSKAVGKSLSEYMSEKVWKPYGMERDAYWMLGTSGHEISGCCISAGLRDYARLGQFILEGGKIHGKSIFLPDWLPNATKKQADINDPGRGYGFQWWTNDDGSFAAQGIFGQTIFLDPKRKLVVALNSDWPAAVGREYGAARAKLFATIQAAVDAQK